jgi:preprotein translocase subunit SecF
VPDVIGRRRWFFLISAILIVPGLVFTLLGPLTGGAVGLRFSIDFTGGTQWEIRFEDRAVTPAQVREVLAGQGFGDATARVASDDYILIRTRPIGFVEPAEPTPTPPAGGQPTPTPPGEGESSPAPPAEAEPTPIPAPPGQAEPAPPGEVTRTGEIGTLAAALEAGLGPIESQRSLTTIGPIISAELTQQAFLLVFVGSLGILLWMTFRFRDFRFGMTALAALIHDVLVVVGSFAILGTLFGLEIDGLFVTAMLTIIGFSVHDTIVVYDRVRENRYRFAGERFATIVNHSIFQTLARSINTSLVVMFTLTGLLLFGGEALRPFVVALLIGIISGTYSSVFNAAPLLTVWEEWDLARRERRSAGRPPRHAHT